MSARPQLKKGMRRAAAVLTAVAILWGAADLTMSGPADLRAFDPQTVANLETDMWRAYYEKRQLALFLQLGQLLRAQFHMPLFRSNLTAYSAALAAFVFKDGGNRADYERALPYLEDFYGAIARHSKIGRAHV